MEDSSGADLASKPRDMYRHGLLPSATPLAGDGLSVELLVGYRWKSWLRGGVWHEGRDVVGRVRHCLSAPLARHVSQEAARSSRGGSIDRGRTAD